MSDLPLNITKYSERDWTKYLTDKYITKGAAIDEDENNPRQDSIGLFKKDEMSKMNKNKSFSH